MKVVGAVILAFWITCGVLVGMIAGTLMIVPLAMEGRVPGTVVPWLFAGIALAGSILAGLLARFIPAVARRYSLPRLVLAGCVGWPLAWWSGLQTQRALQSAGSDGIFAVSATVQHVGVWSALVAAVATTVLLVQYRITRSSAGIAQRS